MNNASMTEIDIEKENKTNSEIQKELLHQLPDLDSEDN
jgi:hypothetical protein